MAFDVLAVADTDLMAEPFRDRRAVLEAMAGAFEAPVHLAPRPSTGRWPGTGTSVSRAPGSTG